MSALRPLALLLAFMLSICHVRAQAVFAHFMVDNTDSWEVSDWESDIDKAMSAHIDAFALNIAHNQTPNDPQIANAFQAAQAKHFQLFFSFDYGGNGFWPIEEVIDLINQYSSNGAYFRRGSQPFVSTFEGPENASDWNTIKERTGCFFIPDWSSKGAQAALELGNADGLFSWAAWPTGPNDMNTYIDASYLFYLNQSLGDKATYMMPVSPWFFTNLPGYAKNWLWRGDSLWYDRWQEVLNVKPDYVEIISWNDFGESHYIGPLRDDEYTAFDVGHAPYNYAKDFYHDGWRDFLPYVIDLYKTGTATITNEGITAWYRNTAGKACGDGGTTGNTALQLQLEYAPSDIMEDKIFYAALLASDATVTVSIGGATLSGAGFDKKPDGGVGIYQGSIATGGRTGAVKVAISRNGAEIASITGSQEIVSSCTGDVTNWNAFVMSALSGNAISVSPGLNDADQGCIHGFGAGNFNGLCNFTCSYDYCPIGACDCTARGKKRTPPTDTGDKGYPIAGEGSSYIGLCSYACAHGYCPPNACGNTDVGLTEPTTSPFLPDTCTGGISTNAYADLCRFACAHGFCPMHTCTCTSTGPLVDLQPNSTDTGKPVSGDDSGLCKYSCARGHCPSDVCFSTDGDGYPDYPINGTDTCAYGNCTMDDRPCDSPPSSVENVALGVVQGKVPEYCVNIYLMKVLHDRLDTALSNYSNIMKNGYDKHFNTYSSYIIDQVPDLITEYMETHGNDHFTCTARRYVVCCGDCQSAVNCEAGCDNSADCVSGYRQVHMPCPPRIPYKLDNATEEDYTYTLVDSDAFYKDIGDKYGIIPDWIIIDPKAEVDVNAGCVPGAGPDSGCFTYYYNLPESNRTIIVPNPKDAISTSLSNLTSLDDELASAYDNSDSFMYPYDEEDVVDGAEIVVFTIEAAVQSMRSVVDTANKISDEEKKETILDFLGGVLFLIPAIGEAVAAIGLETIERIIVLTGDLGTAAMSVYGVVSDPQSAIFDIFGALLGADRDFRVAGEKRRGMKDSELSALGDHVTGSAEPFDHTKLSCPA